MFLSGQHTARHPLRKLAFAGALVCAALLPASAGAWQSGAANPTVRLAHLPFEAQTTYRLIQHGGPFPYAKDGVVFGNRERVLPPQPRGYYREYTVRTPESFDRGARRIVCGGVQAVKPETCYYTRDHYNSFQRIVQ